MVPRHKRINPETSRTTRYAICETNINIKNSLLSTTATSFENLPILENLGLTITRHPHQLNRGGTKESSFHIYHIPAQNKEPTFYQCNSLGAKQTSLNYGGLPTDTISTWLLLKHVHRTVKLLHKIFATEWFFIL